MLEACPGAFVFLGMGDGNECHHPAYMFNDNILAHRIGCDWSRSRCRRADEAASAFAYLAPLAGRGRITSQT
jgi:hypothetical protein